MLYAYSQPAELPTNAIFIVYASSCPSGTTRVSNLDDRLPQFKASSGSTGGSSTHTHTLNAHTHTGVTHSHTIPSHSHTGSISWGANSANQVNSSGGGLNAARAVHTHSGSATSSSNSSSTGDATPDLSSDGAGSTGSGDNWPPYRTVLYCKVD